MGVTYLLRFGVRGDTRGSYRSRQESSRAQGLHVALSRTRAFPVPFFERCRTGSTSSSRLKDSVCWRFISAVSERTCPIKKKGRNRSMSLEGPLLATALITRKPLCILLYGVPSGQLARARKRLPAGNQGRRVAASGAPEDVNTRIRAAGTGRARSQRRVGDACACGRKETACRCLMMASAPRIAHVAGENRLAWRQRDGVRPT